MPYSWRQWEHYGTAWAILTVLTVKRRARVAARKCVTHLVVVSVFIVPSHSVVPITIYFSWRALSRSLGIAPPLIGSFRPTATQCGCPRLLILRSGKDTLPAVTIYLCRRLRHGGRACGGKGRISWTLATARLSMKVPRQFGKPRIHFRCIYKRFGRSKRWQPVAGYQRIP
jgi:hypothetical protein